MEHLMGAVGYCRAASVEGLAEHRRGILTIGDRDAEPGAGTGVSEQHPDQTAAGDQQLDILGHSKSMERRRRSVQCPIASSAFATAANGVVSGGFCAVRGSPVLGEGRHRRGTTWPGR